MKFRFTSALSALSFLFSLSLVSSTETTTIKLSSRRPMSAVNLPPSTPAPTSSLLVSRPTRLKVPSFSTIKNIVVSSGFTRLIASSSLLDLPPFTTEHVLKANGTYEIQVDRIKKYNNLSVAPLLLKPRNGFWMISNLLPGPYIAASIHRSGVFYRDNSNGNLLLNRALNSAYHLFAATNSSRYYGAVDYVNLEKLGKTPRLKIFYSDNQKLDKPLERYGEGSARRADLLFQDLKTSDGSRHVISGTVEALAMSRSRDNPRMLAYSHRVGNVENQSGVPSELVGSRVYIQPFQDKRKVSEPFMFMLPKQLNADTLAISHFDKGNTLVVVNDHEGIVWIIDLNLDDPKNDPEIETFFVDIPYSEQRAPIHNPKVAFSNKKQILVSIKNKLYLFSKNSSGNYFLSAERIASLRRGEEIVELLSQPVLAKDPKLRRVVLVVGHWGTIQKVQFR